MPKFCSEQIPANADFLEICRIVDHVQKKATSHELDSGDIKKSLYIYEAMKGQAKEVFVVCFGGYSFKGFEFKSVCTKLTLTPNGGTVARTEAPIDTYGHGAKFRITLVNPVIPYIVPAAFYVSCREENLAVIESTEKT
jgi:hypothetical protein